MSYSLNVYMIDLGEAKRVIGCKDTKLLEKIRKHKLTSDADDEDSDEEQEAAETDEEDEELSEDVALEHLIMGTRPVAGQAHVYGYALERICRFLGERLDTCYFEGTNSRYLDQVKYVNSLVSRGPPVKLPPIDDFPAIGYLTRDECKSFDCTDLDHPNREVRAGRNELFEWIEAAANEGKDLIGFWC